MSRFLKKFMVLSSVFLLAACQDSADAESEKPEEEVATEDDTEKKDETVDATTEATTEGAYIRNTELEWSAQPELGLVKGDYYSTKERFRQGHEGTFELVQSDNEIVHVQFDEQTRPNYYNRFYQDVPKRLSEYNFDMGDKKGAAWIESVVLVEDQMLEEQRVTGDFDVVSGASNSIEQSMLPLAEKIDEMRSQPTSESYYGIAEDLGNGLTAYLKVILDGDTITEVRYDEIFADDPKDIEDPKLKPFYRQSKYESVSYDEPYRIGFNVQMDALNEKVVETQDLLDLSELPAIDETGDYKSAGFTVRNDSCDNYLALAEKIQDELKADGHL
ncbi:FMN-binding protein [Alkalibacterium kapii]|uniref:FMN-binding domain-containing protein n=1 Tax=Alkalibacterium kapii TaxID=426704 RepID=A0A511AS09_9LACT|nr:FMN-binding protein [Alkalibacterium kapii]GEK90978.1 hypothetical protein AKA01nite_06000 [Alkalibacterium kapii]